MRSSKSTTTADFIAAATVVHGAKYDYSLSVYLNSSTKIDIICGKHGVFAQSPACHVRRRQGCPACGREAIAKANPPGRTTKQFISEAMVVHGGSYDYRSSVYVGLHTKVTILCPSHGDFQQSPSNHLKGAGCPRCAVECRASTIRKSRGDFVNSAGLLHRHKYIYGDYVDDRTPMAIDCEFHGVFTQLPNGHLNGRGCPKCAVDAIKSKLRIPFSEVLPRFLDRHGLLYDYDEHSYTDTKGLIRVRCTTHGWFEQSVASHLLGGGCHRCGSSCFQRSVGEFLDRIGCAVVYNDRSVLGGRELDLLAIDRRFAVECDGVYWHSFDHSESKAERYRHHSKHSLARSVGVSLVSIREDEWADRRPLVESMLRHRLGLSINKIYARNCDISRVTQAFSKPFCDANHVSGFRTASHTYGLSFGGRLVALMSFSPHQKYQYEVIRYCAEVGTCVVGGASKLFSAFRREMAPTRVLSYADRRYSQGSLYERLGFKLDGITGPNYGYVRANVVYSRQTFQKHKLAAKLAVFDPALSESANMFANGYRRLWDAGHYRFIWGA